MSQQNPILMYNRATRRWEGQDSAQGYAIWMDNQTFQRYVWEHLDVQRIYQPTLGDVERAREHCRQLSYWQGCRDPDIHHNSL